MNAIETIQKVIEDGREPTLAQLGVAIGELAEMIKELTEKEIPKCYY
jgi:hypothetical protein